MADKEMSGKVDMHNQNGAPPQYYRRQLPDTCISFNSAKGKKIFSEALQSGHMDGYFGLAAQFRTQDEPAFCGLSTLVMVLNTLEVDPRRVWKGPWRWYHENMLDCCVPIKMVEKSGITLDQFVCLAVCNTLDVKLMRGTHNASLDEFRSATIDACRSNEKVIVASYGRGVLGQTGDGHFSPIGGYHPGKDMVLILDTARFKYPPHWVPLSLLFDATKAIDKDTGLPRGYMVLSKTDTQPMIMFRVAQTFSIPMHITQSAHKGIKSFIASWNEWLGQNQNIPEDQIIQKATSALVEAVKNLTADNYLLTTQVDLKCPESLSVEHKCAVDELVSALDTLPMVDSIDTALSHCELKDAIPRIGRLAETKKACQILSKDTTLGSSMQGKSCSFTQLRPAHFVAAILLAWPFRSYGSSNGNTMSHVAKEQLSQTKAALSNEIHQLHQQFTAVLEIVDKDQCSCGKSCGK